eukprot:2188855-Rhodomonas_salina.1
MCIRDRHSTACRSTTGGTRAHACTRVHTRFRVCAKNAGQMSEIGIASAAKGGKKFRNWRKSLLKNSETGGNPS